MLEIVTIVAPLLPDFCVFEIREGRSVWRRLKFPMVFVCSVFEAWEGVRCGGRP